MAELVNLPFQFNWENGVGSNGDLRHVMNFQPVVPFPLGEKWTLVSRFIVPYINQPAGMVPGSPAVSGTGDITASLFISPRNSGVIWGAGPVFSLPMTTNPLLGSGKWSVGPTGVLLKQTGPWTIGALANHLWSVANTGDIERPDVSRTLFQPFLGYTTKSAFTFTLSSETTYDWKAESGQEWTVPAMLMVSKVARLGPFPFQIAVGGGYYAKSPDGGPDWKMRLSFSVILPRASR